MQKKKERKIRNKRREASASKNNVSKLMSPRIY